MAGLAPGLFALGFAVAVLEGVCRLGWIENPAHARAEKMAGGAGRYRVMIVGDSFSLGVQGHACQRLAERIRGTGGGVFNVGGSGYGPVVYAEMLERFASAYRPDVILVNCYVGNDLTDALGTRPPGRGAALLKSLLQRFHLGELLLQIRARLYHRRHLSQVLRGLEQSGAKAPSGTNAAVNPFLVAGAAEHSDYLLTNLLVEGEPGEQGWRLTAASLERCLAVARRLGARLVIGVFPSTLQVNDSHVEFYRSLGFRYDPRIAKSRRPQDLLLQFGREHDVPVLDLLPGFLAAGSEERFADRDDHWNRAGSQLAAELLWRELTTRRLLPGVGSAASDHGTNHPGPDPAVLRGDLHQPAASGR